MKDCIKVIIFMAIMIGVMLIWVIQMENRLHDSEMDKNQWRSNYMQLWEKVVKSDCDTLLNKPAKPNLQK